MSIKTTSRFFTPTVTIILALLSAMSPFAIDTFLSAMPVMAKDFGVGIGKVEFTITFYFIGFAIGQFFGGPLSDSFGRKKIASIGLLTYALSALAIPYSQNIETVLLLRVLQAVGGGFASVTNIAFLRDWFEGKQFAKLASIITLVMMLAPLVSPIIGGGLMELGGDWHFIFYFMAAISLVTFICLLILLPESRKPEELTHSLTSKQFFGTYKLIISSKPVLLLVLSIGMCMTGMFIFITSAPFIYLEFFKVEQSSFFGLFALGVSGNIFLSLINTFLIKYFKLKTLMRTGMYLQLCAALLLFPLGLMSSPPFILVVIGLVMTVSAIALVFSNGTSLVINSFPKIGGSVNAVIGIVRFTLSSVICSLISFFHTENLRPITIGLLITVVVANALFFWSQRTTKSIESLG